MATSLLSLAQGAIATALTVPRTAKPWRDCGIHSPPFARRPLAIASIFRYHSFVNSKQRKTLSLIFAKPTATAISWRDIESLFDALGATMNQGRGSRIRVELNGHEAIFHTPHPRPVAEQGRIRAVREFLEKAGIQP